MPGCSLVGLTVRAVLDAYEIKGTTPHLRRASSNDAVCSAKLAPKDACAILRRRHSRPTSILPPRFFEAPVDIIRRARGPAGVSKAAVRGFGVAPRFALRGLLPKPGQAR